MTTPQDTLLSLFTPGGRSNPYPLYSRLLEQAPVAAIGSQHALVTGYQESSDVLLNHRLFRVPDRSYADRFWSGWRNHASAAALYRSLLFLNPPESQPVRRLVYRFFSPKRVEQMRRMIGRHAAAHVAPLIANTGSVDATQSFVNIPNTVIGELLGIPHRDMRQLAEWLDMFLERNELHPPDSRLESADDVTPQIFSYIREKLLEFYADDETNLVGSLAQHWKAADEQDLISNLIFILGAGTVTTVSLLGSGLLQLAKDNALLHRLHTDDTLLKSFVLEVVRHDPPIQYGARVAAEDTELGGVHIPRDTLLLVCFGALGRDPRRFANPNNFVADRFVSGESDQNDVVSFGLGTHRCVGADLALTTGEIAFRELAQRIERLSLVSSPHRQNRSVVRKFSRLEVQTLRRSAV
ncbi:cytochrome P450 [Saccharopolyspora sp. ASAGF58]|uniref:cytochrome P450 n=1 Tax=Saccharopolyspora sp. ASAGF58 TaxID=2719023 RepID=UPI00143FE5A1|nr:cytochrome P450 [Saccharopolyspora sp. ASAGF58]QIZ33779.1 cytochrome P450 [Saccharopolyspora sp. ASAGF58]